MYFNSMAYIFGFLPVVIIVYFSLNRYKLIILGKIWLLAASIFFYAWFNVKYTPLLLIYVLMNFGFYKLIRMSLEKDKNKSKKVLICAIIVNLLVLLGFKYLGFFIESINEIFKSSLPFVNILVPLAISLQTLQQICFLTDSYKNKDMDFSLLDYSLFSIFFPQMIVGPIVKYNETIPQFNNLRRKLFNHKNFIIGLSIFLIGFYKKGFLAAPLNDSIIDKLPLISSMSTIEGWMFCVMEYFHAYLDISSYMDMVIGSALMLNIDLPINFNSPMQSKNIIEFWERWQITFARFMKNYVYIPLKSLNPKNWFVDFSIMITCLLGGLWQGASVCAIIWGFLHGLGFLINRAWKRLNIKLPGFAALCLTFLFVAFTGMLLRVQTLSEMGELSSKLFSRAAFGAISFDWHFLCFYGFESERRWEIIPIIICIIGIVLTLFKISIEGKDLAKFVKPNFIWAFVLAVAIVELIYFYAPPTGFLYYNF